MPELMERQGILPKPETAPQKMPRRQMLMTLGIALNTIAGILFAVPVVGYIFAPSKRKEINCTHLGCPVRWFPQSGLFMCPCHGGAYYADGARASGPPPRGLFQYDYKIEGGELWIKAGQVPTLASPPSQACVEQPKRCACA